LTFEHILADIVMNKAEFISNTASNIWLT